MNTNLTQEHVSALIDGEVGEGQIEVTLASLRAPEQREIWEMYHQIGDALRSDETVLTLSADFSSRLFARLEAEPTIIAPAGTTSVRAEAVTASDHSRHAGVELMSAKRTWKRFALPGMAAAAAVATVAFITTPQMMVAGDSSSPTASTAVVAVSAPSTIVNAALESRAVAVPALAKATSASAEVMLRDPRIDDYLFAHQGFSSSMYSTAQFARSATLTADSAK